MKLVLYSKQSIVQLKQQARAHFSHLSSQVSLVTTSEKPLRLKSQLATQTSVKIKNEASALDILFQVPTPIEDLNYKTAIYIEHLITQRTQGSLFSFLNKLGLVTNISISHLGDRDYGLLDIYFVLTEKGLRNKGQVISSLFSYIDMLKTVKHPNRIYEELSVLAKRDFEYYSFDEPGDWIDKINSDMFIYPLKNVINHNANYQGLDKHQLKTYLNIFSPNNMQVFLSSAKVVADKIEPLYNMPYSVSAYDEKQLNNWRNPKLNSYFSLPKVNPFLSTSELDNYDVDEVEPAVLLKKAGFTLWEKSDNTYQQSKMSSVFNIYTDQKNNSEESTVIRLLHSQITRNKMNDFGYYAQLAGFDFNIEAKTMGYQLSVTGFNDKTLDLLNNMLEQFNDINVSKNAFFHAKEEVIQTLREQQNDYPYKQVSKAVYQANLAHSYANNKLLAILKHLRFEQYQTHVHELNKAIEIEGIVAGDFDKQETNRFAKKVYKHNKEKLYKGLKELGLQNDLTSNIKEPRLLQLNHDDSSIAYSVQGKMTDIKHHAMFKLISAMMKPEYYKYIRNDKNLGYFVHSHDLNINDTPGVIMVIQSDKYSVKVMKSEISIFLKTYYYQLSALTELEFDKTKNRIVKRLLKPDNNIKKYTQKLASQMHLNSDGFDKNQNIIKAINLVDKATLLDFYEKHFIEKTSNPLIIYSLGNSKEMLKNTCITAKCL